MISTSPWQILTSDQDWSVNHVQPTLDGGMLEARWVQRQHDYGIVYVSSHTGCALSCRFCHLTATGQTMMTPVDVEGYVRQMRQGLSTYQQRRQEGAVPAAAKLHVNFMARGEALANPTMVHRSQEVFAALEQEAWAVQDGWPVHFLVSSILPRDFSADLVHVLDHPLATLCYSLYSLDPGFRKRWLPKAMSGEDGLDVCADYQRRTGRRVTLHWAMIAGHNDSDATIDAIIKAVHDRGLRVKFNLVRYNPHDQRHGVETDEARLAVVFARLREAFGDEDSRVVPRVGHDVKASCGMFVER